MRVLILFSILSLIFASPVFSNDLDNVTNMMKENISVVIETLKNKKIDKSTRNKKILDTITPMIDFKRMVKLCLGKKHWVRLNNEKRKEFTNLFLKRIKESILEKLDLYTDEDIIVEKANKVKNRINVLTYLVMAGDKKEMVYKFYKLKKEWKVYDIEIIGVSVVQTYRSQFTGALKKGTIDDLINKLKTSDEFKFDTGNKKS